MLKKLISTSRKLAALQTDSARLLWTWILPHADITGRFSAEPDVIKGYIVPRLKKMTVAKIAKYLDDMADRKLITLYKVNGDSYLEIVKFHKFQSLRADREADSVIPPPPDPGPTPGVAPENSRLSKDKISQEKLSKTKYMEFVLLSLKEFDALGEKFGEQGRMDRIAALNDYIGSKGKKYKSHYHTILTWERRNGNTGKSQRANSPQAGGGQNRQSRRDCSEGGSGIGTVLEV